MELFGKKLRERAKELGLTDADVARQSGLTERRYGNYVTGRRQPDFITLLNICKTLKASPNYLLGLETNSKRSKKEALKERLVRECESFNERELELAINLAIAISKTH